MGVCSSCSACSDKVEEQKRQAEKQAKMEQEACRAEPWPESPNSSPRKGNKGFVNLRKSRSSSGKHPPSGSDGEARVLPYLGWSSPQWCRALCTRLWFSSQRVIANLTLQLYWWKVTELADQPTAALAGCCWEVLYGVYAAVGGGQFDRLCSISPCAALGELWAVGQQSCHQRSVLAWRIVYSTMRVTQWGNENPVLAESQPGRTQEQERVTQQWPGSGWHNYMFYKFLIIGKRNSNLLFWVNLWWSERGEAPDLKL